MAYVVALGLFGGIGTGCAVLGGESYEVRFDQDVLLSTPEETKTVKRDEVIVVGAAPMMATRAGHRAVMLIPIPNHSGTVQVSMPKADAVSDAGSGAAGERGGVAGNALARGIVDVQTAMAAGKVDEALVRIAALRAEFPKVSYLQFFEAGAYVVKRDLAKARLLTESALREFPDDPAGVALLKELGNSGAAGSERRK